MLVDKLQMAFPLLLQFQIHIVVSDLGASWFLLCTKQCCLTCHYQIKLPFVQWPKPVFLENYNMSESERLFVTEAIQELVDNNCAAEVCTPPLVCSPLQVVARDGGKHRLVIDLRYVNQYLHKFKFKYEGLDVATQLLEDCSWMTTFDLKSGYHHIDIHPVYQQYLGFSWRKDGERIYYVFRVLPFSLATACYVFTKVLRPLVSRWRSKGVKMVLYIDDGFV